MASSNEIANNILNFTPDQFQSIQPGDFSPYKRKLAREDFQGIAIVAPKTIDTKRQGQLPVILAAQESGLRAWEIAREINSVLIGCDLHSGEIRIRRLFQDKKLESSHAPVEVSRPPKPKGSDADSRITGM